MKIYLAGPFERAKELSRIRVSLERDGHEITSRWLSEHGEAKTEDEIRRHAFADIEDIDRADALVLYTIYEGNARGGRHFEAGYAYHANKQIFIIGPRRNVFHYLPDVPAFDSLAKLRDGLKFHASARDLVLA